MKIYRSKQECEDAAINFCINHTIELDRIDTGAYKGGKYDCLFVLNESGNEVFAGAY